MNEAVLNATSSPSSPDIRGHEVPLWLPSVAGWVLVEPSDGFVYVLLGITSLDCGNLLCGSSMGIWAVLVWLSGVQSVHRGVRLLG